MIYLECRPDYSLVRSLVRISKKEIIHEFKGKFEICKRLESARNCKGLIDEDPASLQPEYLRRLRRLEDLSHADIVLLGDSNAGNRLIVLRPRLEEWILRASKESAIDVKKYGLPDEGKSLHSVINVGIDKFEKLLEDLKVSSSRLKTLRKLLEIS